MALSFQDKIRPVGGATSTQNVSFASKIRPISSVATPPPQSSGTGDLLMGMVKGLLSAPATLVARPVQAAAELMGASAEDVNKYNLGGLIAPVPKTYGDVTKDIGRGIQTVALGTGTPLAGGAAFGLGSSLERQGSDVFSIPGATSAAFETALGMGAGKAIDFIGKPILNATGKVIGKIVPEDLIKVANKGTTAIQKFAAEHQLLSGAVAPLSEKIATKAQAFDTGVNTLATKAGTGAKKLFQSQYPGTTEKAIQKHFEDIEVGRLMEPATVSGKTYNKSADVLKNAQKQGVDIVKTLKQNKVYADEHIVDGKFNTQDVADALADEAKGGGAEFLRPALAEAEQGVQRAPISEVRNRILTKISKIPNTQLSPTQKLDFAKRVAKEYADDSVTAAMYKDGYSLTNLYDSKLQTSSSLYKEPKMGGVQSISDSLMGKQKKIESDVFGDILKETAPKELGLDAYFKAQQAKFITANYLRTLDGNKAPQTLFQRGVRRASQLAGATTGASVAGPFGMFSGYQFGGIAADTFANMSNPVKLAYLRSIGKTQPEIYIIMKEYVGAKQTERLLRNALPVGNPAPVLPNNMGTPNRSQPIFTGGMTQRINPQGNLTPEAIQRLNNESIKLGKAGPHVLNLKK